LEIGNDNQLAFEILRFKYFLFDQLINYTSSIVDSDTVSKNIIDLQKENIFNQTDRMLSINGSTIDQEFGLFLP
jgi:hypothetical protein